MLSRLTGQNPGDRIRFGKDYNIRRSSPAAAMTFYGPGWRSTGRKTPA